MLFPVFVWIHLSAMDYRRTQCMLSLQPISALLLEVCATVASCELSWLRCRHARCSAAPAMAAAASAGGVGLLYSPWLNLPVEFTRAHYNSEA